MPTEEERLRREMRNTYDALELAERQRDEALFDLGQKTARLAIAESRVAAILSREPGSLRSDLECMLEEDERASDDDDGLADSVRDLVLAILCRHLGHAPRVDHCGKPEHDYCDACGATTPGAAKRG